MASNLEHIEGESSTNENFKKVLLLYPALIIEAVLGVEVNDHVTFNSRVLTQLHATDANQKVGELLSVLERGVFSGGIQFNDKFNKDIHDGLRKAFSLAVANEDALKYYRSLGNGDKNFWLELKFKVANRKSLFGHID